MSEEFKVFGNARYAFRRDTLENWEAENPVLLAGEIGVVTDNGEILKVKIGDGKTAWNNLSWWKGPKGEKGDKGDKGEQGIQGFSGIDGNDGTPATHSWNGTILTVTSASGTSSANLKGEKGADGKDGQDYILTETDKQEIADMVDVPVGDIETALDEIIEIQESLKDEYTGGTGGVSSWNDLTDKPFYDEGTKTATLDYANPPAVGVDLMGDVLYKVTDDILTEADINSANISLSGTIGGIDTNFSQELNVDTAMAAVSFPFGMVYQFGYEINGTEVVVMIGAVTQTGEFEEFGVTFNIFETGTYVDYSFMSGEGTINSISLEYAGELKTLDIKFIPDDLYTEIDQRIENYINEALGGDY